MVKFSEVFRLTDAFLALSSLMMIVQDPEEFDNNSTYETLDNEIQKIMELAAKLRNIDEEVSSSQGYVHKVRALFCNTLGFDV